MVITLSTGLSINGQVVTDIVRVDLGLMMNNEPLFEDSPFEPGELWQITGRVKGLKIWVAHNTRFDQYRVSFGEKPMALGYCPAMDAESAICEIIRTVLNHG